MVRIRLVFGAETVLHDVSYDFEEGFIHGIVGNNGSGKTVLMKCICGFLLPTSGKIFVSDKQVGKDMDFPDDIGIIIETPGFLPNLSGMKNYLQSLTMQKMRYLDSLGFLASVANKYFLKQAYPTSKQVAFWDKYLVPVSKPLDVIINFGTGKTLIGVWKK